MKNDKLKEIAKYSKEEILEALARQYMPDLVTDRLLSDLEYIRRTKALQEQDNALVAERTALDAFLAWQKGMIERYGDGESVRFNQVPEREIERGLKLEKAYNAARKERQQAEAKVNRLLGL